MRMSGSRYGGQVARYRCRAHVYGADARNGGCSATALAPAVDAAVLAEVAPALDRLLTRDRRFRAALARAWAELAGATEADDTAARIANLERRSAKHRERLATAARMLVDGDLDRTGYELLRDETCAEAQATERELATLRAQAAPEKVPPLEAVLAKIGDWTATLGGPNLEEQRGVLAELVATVTPERVSQSVYKARVKWTATGQAIRAMAAGAEAGGIAKCGLDSAATPSVRGRRTLTA
jgi:hypothetical protein